MRSQASWLYRRYETGVCTLHVFCCDEFPQTLKQQKFILSRFGRPEVQHRGVGRARLLPKALGEIPSLALAASGGSRGSLAWGSITPRLLFCVRLLSTST